MSGSLSLFHRSKFRQLRDIGRDAPRLVSGQSAG